MDFIQLGGNSRVDEMILARVSSGFAGGKYGRTSKLYLGLLGGKDGFMDWKLLFFDVATSFDSAVHRVHAVLFDAALCCCCFGCLTTKNCYVKEVDTFLVPKDSIPPGIESDFDSEGDIVHAQWLSNGGTNAGKHEDVMGFFAKIHNVEYKLDRTDFKLKGNFPEIMLHVFEEFFFSAGLDIPFDHEISRWEFAMSANPWCTSIKNSNRNLQSFRELFIYLLWIKSHSRKDSLLVIDDQPIGLKCFSCRLHTRLHQGGNSLASPHKFKWFIPVWGNQDWSLEDKGHAPAGRQKVPFFYGQVNVVFS
ncbi:hypothetical protein Tco_1360879 [Tanacetum coccineum]